MSDITATVTSEQQITVSAVGIQGLSAAEAGVSGLNDVDTTTLNNGSVLVYKTATSKWTASTTLEDQNITGGQY